MSRETTPLWIKYKTFNIYTNSMDIIKSVK